MNDCLINKSTETRPILGRFLAGATLAFWMSGPAVFAGDPIILSTQKPKINPELEKSFDKDLLRSWSKLPNRTPLDGYSSPSESTPINPRQDKKTRDAQAEKKNWLLLEPGELQDQDDEASFGIKDYSLDDLEKKEEVKDYTFYKMRPGKSSTYNNRTPGQRSKQDDKQNQADKKRSDDFDLDGTDDSRDSLGLGFDSEKSGRNGKSGAHVAKELSMDTPFSPKKTEDGLSGNDQSGLTLRSLLEAPGGGTGTRAEHNRSGNFQPGLASGQSGSGSLGLSARGSTLSGAARGDYNSAGSLSPKLGDTAPRIAPPGGFSPSPNPGGAAGRFGGPSLSDGNFSRNPIGPGDSSSSFRASEPSRPLGQSPLLEPPRRKF